MHLLETCSEFFSVRAGLKQKYGISNDDFVCPLFELDPTPVELSNFCALILRALRDVP
jgi:hypothetical protein